MSIGWLIIWFIFSFFALLLFFPFFFVVDSEERRLSIRWLFVNVGFNFKEKRSTVRIAGIPIGKGKKPGETPPVRSAEEVKEKGEEEKEEKKEEEKEEAEASARPSMMKILLSHRGMIIRLTELAVRYFIDLLRAFSVSFLQIDLSLDDPMANGICYGAVQGVRIKRVRFAVNFWGENRFVGQFALPLYRLIAPTAKLVVRLPYSEMYRVFKEVRNPGSVRKEEVSA